MVTIANLSFDTAGEKNLTFDAEGQKNLIANYAPLPYYEDMTVTRDNDDRWTFTWTSTDTPFELYLQGEFIASTEDGTYSLVSEEEIALEVYAYSEAAEALTLINKPYADLQWFSPAEQSYLVDRYIDPLWKQQGQPQGDAGTGYYSRNTGFLGDDLEENWSVTPRNEWETEGDAVEHPFNVISHPNPPEFTATITAGSIVIGSI